MKRYRVAEAREQFAAVLDEADASGAVAIERGDVRYVIKPQRRRRAAPRQPPRIDVLDPAIDSGQWTWDLTAAGVRFRAGTRRRR
jgi:hypothetical protein